MEPKCVIIKTIGGRAVRVVTIVQLQPLWSNSRDEKCCWEDFAALPGRREDISLAGIKNPEGFRQQLND